MKLRLLLTLLIACLSGSALADDTAVYGIGGAIQPVAEHPSIVAMLVSIDLYHDHATVDSSFILRHGGRAAKLRVAFPEHACRVPEGEEPKGFTSFRMWVDGEETEATIEGPIPVPDAPEPTTWHRWRVAEIPVSPGRTRSLRVLYETELDVQQDSGDRVFRYLTRTAGGWSGPIGSAQIRLNLHYGPHGGWFELLGPRFERVGPCSFEWKRQSFEPSPDDDVDVIYHRPCVGIYVGPDHVHRGDPPRPHITGGRLWAQIREVADWLHADLRVDGAQATLVRGGTTAVVRAGSQRARVGSKTTLLPAAPRIERGRLMVPVSAIIRPFGAEVEFLAPSKTVHIILPVHREFLRILGPFDAAAALSAIPIGWAPPAVTDYDPNLRRDVEHPQRWWPPWMCTGNFDDDPTPEAAFLLRKGDQYGLGLLQKIADGVVSFGWLDVLPSAAPGPLTTVLDRLPSGETVFHRKGETAPESGRLDLQHDAIELTGERASLVYYWDAESGQYKVIRTDE